jgi:hypothetical protein
VGRLLLPLHSSLLVCSCPPSPVLHLAALSACHCRHDCSIDLCVRLISGGLRIERRRDDERMEGRSERSDSDQRSATPAERGRRENQRGIECDDGEMCST